MKQLDKQSMKELMKFALEMPAGDLTKYGTLFLSGPIPDKMTRGELIALQLVERASYGDLDALKELRQWIVEDPKAPVGGSNYYQFLIQLSGEKDTPDLMSTAPNLQKLARIIETQATPSSVDLSVLDDLL